MQKTTLLLTERVESDFSKSRILLHVYFNGVVGELFTASIADQAPGRLGGQFLHLFDSRVVSAERASFNCGLERCHRSSCFFGPIVPEEFLLRCIFRVHFVVLFDFFSDCLERRQVEVARPNRRGSVYPRLFPCQFAGRFPVRAVLSFPVTRLYYLGLERVASGGNFEDFLHMFEKLCGVRLINRQASLKFKLSIKLGKLGVHQRGRLAHAGKGEGGDKKRKCAHCKFCV